MNFINNLQQLFTLLHFLFSPLMVDHINEPTREHLDAVPLRRQGWSFRAWLLIVFIPGVTDQQIKGSQLPTSKRKPGQQAKKRKCSRTAQQVGSHNTCKREQNSSKLVRNRWPRLSHYAENISLCVFDQSKKRSLSVLLLMFKNAAWHL